MGRRSKGREEVGWTGVEEQMLRHPHLSSTQSKTLEEESVCLAGTGAMMLVVALRSLLVEKLEVYQASLRERDRGDKQGYVCLE